MALGFLTNKEAREQITGLETRVSELESEVTAANEARDAAQNELAPVQQELAEAKQDLTNASERITELEAQATKDAGTIADLTEKAKYTAEKVSLEASRQVAALGHKDPVDDPAGEDGNPGNPTTRALKNWSK